MSRQTALDNLLLAPSERWGHTEYSLNYHHDAIRDHTGRDSADPRAIQEFFAHWQIDFRWCTHDGLLGNWAEHGRCTDMGHAVYDADGTDKRQSGTCPFQTPEDVWAFDAVAEYGLPDKTAQIEAYQQIIDDARRAFPDQLTPGGYYKTLVSGAIDAFGWDMFLLALSEPARMEPVFDSFFRRTLFHMEAWAKTDVEVVIQHDDFVWSAGAFMNPRIYHEVIIPRYAELWKPIHAAGKKVIFCSDANFMAFAEAVAEAGADAFAFEPMTDFEFMVERFGSSHCLIGSCVDCRDMTLMHEDQVKADLERTSELLARCRGAILATGNHLPPNIPAPMINLYRTSLLPRLQRTQPKFP